MLVQVLNRGNNSVGGDFLDEAILNYVLKDHANKCGWSIETAPSVNLNMRAKLLTQCETAKIALSFREKANIIVPNYYRSDDENAAEIDIWLDKATLENISYRIVEQGLREIDHLLSVDQANVDSQTIKLCLATGGMVNMPMIQSRLIERFGLAALEISKKGDRIISEGAAWIARDNPKLMLAKPFELVEARNSLLTVIAQGKELPTRGYSIVRKQSMYCSDPRDGKAIFTFKRPQMVNKNAAADHRTTYGSLVVEVNPEFPPLEERIELKVTIDDNLIVHCEAVAEDAQEAVSTDFYDLEFALNILPSLHHPEKNRIRTRLLPDRNGPKQLLSRANVALVPLNNEKPWDTVPGELLKAFNDKYRFRQQSMTDIQQKEYVRYQPCSNCGARWMKGCCTTRPTLSQKSW